MKLRGYWKNASPSDVKVKDSSGEGGSRTIKMTVKGEEPENVAFHARKGSVVEGFGDAISKDAINVFHSHGIGPWMIAEGHNWWIEEWKGKGPVGKAPCSGL